MSPRHQRRLLILAEYLLDIEYLQGKENKVADFLSRFGKVNIMEEESQSSNNNLNQEENVSRAR